MKLQRMKKILMVVPTLNLGGAERVAHILATSLQDHGYEIILISRTKTPDFYILPNTIHRINLSPLKKTTTPLGAYIQNKRLIAEYKKQFKQIKPDLIISFMNRTNIRTLLAARNLKIPVIITEHNYPPENPLGKIWEYLRKKNYPFATKLISISKGTDGFFTWMPSEKKVIINNPVFDEKKIKGFSNIEKEKIIISAGRLKAVKNYPLLINAFNNISNEFPEWKLIILGEGDKRAELEALIEKLKLQSRVELPGMVSSIGPYLDKSSIFCLTSLTEGFGNVIIEAMHHKLPVISTDCPTGPAEIIKHGTNGLLVPNNDLNGLTKQLRTLILDPELSKKIADNGYNESKKYSIPQIMKQWENLLEKL